ncbi:MAG: formylglycine-generating enzyme family protein [Acidimicrobiales bacterium]
MHRVVPSPPSATTDDLVWIPDRDFTMGSDEHYPEESPAHRVSVDGFWMSPTAVTNRQFAAFVEATGYVTLAERPLDPAQYPGALAENLVAGSLVFTMTTGPVDLRHLSQWWTWTPGASWFRPEGPGSKIDRRADHPVVHVAHEDAVAYAGWLGHELPSEAEWELAARGGLDGKPFVWGDEAVPDGRYMANFWQGEFPWDNSGADGFVGTAPVGSFPANEFGLHEMAGNVWEWTEDWYTDAHPEPSDKACCVPRNPRGPSLDSSFDPAQPQFVIPRKVIKGGSYLCADNYCRRYRPAARRPQMIDTGMSHIGFRTIKRSPTLRPEVD